METNARIIRRLTDNITVTKKLKDMTKLDYYSMHDHRARKLITGSILRKSDETTETTERILALLNEMYNTEFNLK
jgi:hypothetical protein